MILQSLADYYEALASLGRIARPGWGRVRIQYALEIDCNGTPVGLLPLESLDAKGKPIPRILEMPAPVKRTVGIDPNFLWDNAAYVLGIDSKGKPERAVRCFEAARNLHRLLLDHLSDSFAIAICSFFEKWSAPQTYNNVLFAEAMDDFAKGANITFMYRGELANDNGVLKQIWQAYYDNRQDENKPHMRCLITGQETVPEATHPSIKRVRGAQSSGAALVSFNADAFCSYGKEQNLNAPVSKLAAFAYTTALNYLLEDNAHVKAIGDTTVVYWAESADPQYQDAFGCFIEGNVVTDYDLNAVMGALSRGKTVDWDGLPLKPDNRFYVLGLAPNAARISVRFFLRDTFGDYADHIGKHYERIRIVKPDYDKDENISLWKLLSETTNPKASDKSASPQMAGDTMKAIFSGTRYPATLFQQTMMRIRAEKRVSRGRSAIIKAYLLKNSTNIDLKEDATVALNESTNSVPYVLGRLFSILENIQDSASGASTVKDRYFNSACSTPATVFPLLLKLKNSHMKVMMRDKPGLAVSFDKQVTELIGRLPEKFPSHLSLEEQGAFILGYYHQTQKRYEKKTQSAIENKEEN